MVAEGASLECKGSLGTWEGGWTLDVLCTNIVINNETIQLFLIKFIDVGSTILY